MENTIKFSNVTQTALSIYPRVLVKNMNKHRYSPLSKILC
jgi:hypothetical protein